MHAHNYFTKIGGVAFNIRHSISVCFSFFFFFIWSCSACRILLIIPKTLDMLAVWLSWAWFATFLTRCSSLICYGFCFLENTNCFETKCGFMFGLDNQSFKNVDPYFGERRKTGYSLLHVFSLWQNITPSSNNINNFIYPLLCGNCT